MLQPSLFPAAGPHPRTTAEVYDAADVLVQRGLRRKFGHATDGRRRDRHARYPAWRHAGEAGPGGMPELPAGQTSGSGSRSSSSR